MDGLLQNGKSGPTWAREVAEEEVGEERSLADAGLAHSHDCYGLASFIQASQPLLLEPLFQVRRQRRLAVLAVRLAL